MATRRTDRAGAEGTSSSGGSAHSVLSDIAASAADGFRRAKQDAADAAERTAPAIKRSLSKSAYTLAYCLAFGAVYSAEVVKEMLPEDGVILQGFRDGAGAARETRSAHRGPEAAAPAPEPAL
jgi:hypothetical protein